MFQSLWLSGSVIVFLSVWLSIGGLWAVRRLASPQSLREHHDVAGFILAIVGVIYAVLLAFVVIVVWEQFEDAKSDAAREANALTDIYRMSEGFPPPAKAQVRKEIRTYAKAVVEKEWNTMDSGQPEPEAIEAMDNLWITFAHLDSSDTRVDHLIDSSLQRLNDASDLRRLRLLESHDGLPRFMWVVLILGGMGTMLFTYFFGLEKFPTQAAMTAILAGLIALVLVLINALNYPYSGDIKVQPEAMENLLHRLPSIEAHEAERRTSLEANP